ncbi:MAG: AbrB/MazE/SpoVT family DNA-binding domain-containing protein [Desulfobacteria bacterium]
MQAVKVLPKGQITLPKEIRQMLGIREGDTLLMDTDGSRATIKKGKTIFDFKGALPNLGMSIDKIREKAVAGGVGADE